MSAASRSRGASVGLTLEALLALCRDVAVTPAILSFATIRALFWSALVAGRDGKQTDLEHGENPLAEEQSNSGDAESKAGGEEDGGSASPALNLRYFSLFLLQAVRSMPDGALSFALDDEDEEDEEDEEDDKVTEATREKRCVLGFLRYLELSEASANLRWKQHFFSFKLYFMWCDEDTQVNFVRQTWFTQGGAISLLKYSRSLLNLRMKSGAVHKNHWPAENSLLTANDQNTEKLESIPDNQHSITTKMSMKVEAKINDVITKPPKYSTVFLMVLPRQ